MASRMKVVGIPSLPFIYNVSQHVGPGQANLADDVELVQFLIAEILKKPRPGKARRIEGPPPAVTRSFDLLTGFWIYEIQFTLGTADQATFDGVVSPARGGNIQYGGGKFWVIGALNSSYQQSFPENFLKLHEDGRLSGSLRSSIKPG